MQVKKQQLEPDMEQPIGSTLVPHQDFILSPCLFSLYVEHSMQNSGLDKAKAGMKIAGRNISNLTYADGTTFMAESEEN